MTKLTVSFHMRSHNAFRRQKVLDWERLRVRHIQILANSVAFMNFTAVPASYATSFIRYTQTRFTRKKDNDLDQLLVRVGSLLYT